MHSQEGLRRKQDPSLPHGRAGAALVSGAEHPDLAGPTVALWVSWMCFHGSVVEISRSPLSPGLRERVLKGAHQGEEPLSQGPSVGAASSARNTTQLSQESPERLMQVPGHTGWVPPPGLSLLRHWPPSCSGCPEQQSRLKRGVRVGTLVVGGSYCLQPFRPPSPGTSPGSLGWAPASAPCAAWG